MFTQSLKLEVRGANDRIYSLHLDPSSPLGEIADALSTMKAVVLKQMNEQHEKERDEALKLLDDSCKEYEESKGEE